jgi:hypothetical protein
MDGSEDDIGSLEGNAESSPGIGPPPFEGVITMRTKRTYIITLLATGAGAVAIAAAPLAAAAPAPTAAVQQTCSSTGSGTVCQSPGNVQLNAATPPVSFDPYGGEEFLMGGYGYRGIGVPGIGVAGGGFHGGGGGHR